MEEVRKIFSSSALDLFRLVISVNGPMEIRATKERYGRGLGVHVTPLRHTTA